MNELGWLMLVSAIGLAPILCVAFSILYCHKRMRESFERWRQELPDGKV